MSNQRELDEGAIREVVAVAFDRLSALSVPHQALALKLIEAELLLTAHLDDEEDNRAVTG